MGLGPRAVHGPLKRGKPTPKPPDCASEQSEYNQETEGKWPPTAPFTRWAAALQPQRPFLLPITETTGTALGRPAPLKGSDGYAPTPGVARSPRLTAAVYPVFTGADPESTTNLLARNRRLPRRPMSKQDITDAGGPSIHQHRSRLPLRPMSK